MIDPTRVLRPLHEAEGAITQLREYRSAAELSQALDACWRALERTLRLLLRDDPAAPDELRLAALSPADVPWERLVEALRQRDLISIELAGTLHELHAAAGRAASGEAQAADADLARRAIERTRAELHALDERPVREVVHHAVQARMLDETAHSVPPPQPERRSMLRFGVAVAVLALVAIVVIQLVRRDAHLEDGVAAFRAGRLDAAEDAFRQSLQRDPDNVTAHLYLGRIYRRQARYEAAASALRTAARLDPNDAAVQRELGHLFLDLDQPRSAAERYRRALELEPEQELNWIGLIRALRAADDPAADDVLRRAPPGVRAVFGGASAARAPPRPRPAQLA